MLIKTSPAALVLVTLIFSTHAAAQERIDCANASTTADLNACADEELSKADAALNEAYKRALAAIPALASDKPYDAKSWEEALRASQRAWVAYRDAECKGHVAMFWSGGSGASADILGCMSELTRARTKSLVEQYQQR